MEPTRKRVLGATSVWLALGLALAGCSSSPSGGTAGTSPSGGTAGTNPSGESNATTPGAATAGSGASAGSSAGSSAAPSSVSAGTLPDSCKAQSPVIGVSLPDSTNPYYVAMRKGFQEEAQAKGMTAKVAIANDSDATQLSQVESFIQQKVCVVALNPVSSGPAAADVVALNRAGIPVFTVNVLVSATDLQKQGGKIVQFLGADQVEGGRVMAEQVLKDMGQNAKITVGIVGDPNSETTNARDKGFTDALKADPNVSVKTTVNGQVDPNVGLQVTTDMLQGNPDINVIYSDTGPTTLGALRAVNQLGRSDKVSIYGFCAADTALDGPYKACTAQEPEDYGKRVVDNIRQYLDGKPVPTSILRPLVTFGPGQKPGPGLLG